MNYKLNDMVFLVHGKKRGCIYDLNANKLYSIGERESNFIEDLIYKRNSCNGIENELIKKLIDLNILTQGTQDLAKIDKLKLKDPLLEFAWLEITQKCNCKCLHCYNHDNKNPTKDITMPDFILAVNKLAESNVKKIQLIGGEPLLAKNFIDMINYIYDKFEVSIFTNSLLWTAEKIAILKEKNIKQICSTIFSYLPIEHDKVTGVKGSHTKALRNLKKLKENNFDVEIFNVKMAEIDLGKKDTDLYDLSKKTDFVRICGKGDFSLYNIDLLKKKLITKQRFAYKLNSKRVLEAMNFHHCFASKVYIDVNLDVYPCAMERKVKYGNLKNNSLFNLHNKKIYKTTKDEVNECKFCEYRYACSDCRADSLNADFYEKPWFCTYKPLEGTWENLDDFIKNFKHMSLLK